MKVHIEIDGRKKMNKIETILVHGNYEFFIALIEPI